LYNDDSKQPDDKCKPTTQPTLPAPPQNLPCTQQTPTQMPPLGTSLPLVDAIAPVDYKQLLNEFDEECQWLAQQRPMTQSSLTAPLVPLPCMQHTNILYATKDDALHPAAAAKISVTADLAYYEACPPTKVLA